MVTSVSTRIGLGITAATALALGSLAAVSPPAHANAAAYYLVSDASIEESDSGKTTMNFVVQRLGDVNSVAGSVRFSTVNGDPGDSASALSPSDYVGRTNVKVKFPVGQSIAIATVKIKGDILTEYDENFSVQLSDPVEGELIDPFGVGTIANNDPGLPPAYTVSGAIGPEGDSGTSKLAFTITRLGSTAVAGSVRYYTMSIQDHATPGEDFVNKKPTKVSFPKDVTTKKVYITIKGDTDVEDDEQFLVGLSDPVNGQIDPFSYAHGRIDNDD
ncbi:hypothetical protein F0U44_13325 [Nocardioides humilatus]|uniref:Calx-beta domain-containing protein n=1 Tax=Nocardioides humilatus TaxID=2607660 RepID=A0A5B1LF82_9ACTN|nr:Calx-beta domain-containing protein [Nocardioides humilatus]KAA1419411.1 hypothetical protein F0U44_13325 [Nocardioides humilatus]